MRKPYEKPAIVESAPFDIVGESSSVLLARVAAMLPKRDCIGPHREGTAPRAAAGSDFCYDCLDSADRTLED